MVLIDTSVWIEFLRGNKNYYEEVTEILESGNAHATEAIFAELLQGAKDKRETDIIRGYWENINHYSEDGLWIEAGLKAGRERLYTKGVGIIDVMILTYAARYRTSVWSLDKKLCSIAQKNLLYKI